MIAVRRVAEEDAPQVRKLIDEVFHAEFPGEDRGFAYEDLDNPVASYGGKRDTFLVAECSGGIVGTVAIKEDDRNTAFLRRVFVRKEYRGKGYGQRLLDEAVAFCRDHHYKRIRFHGTDRMKTALQLCKRNGFEEKDIHLAADLTMVILEKNLNSHHA